MASRASTTFPHIVRDPLILSGEPVMRGTRISVRSVVQYFRLYGSVDEVCAAYPWVSRDAIEDALAFYRANSEEIDGHIAADDAGDD